jgi:tRNA(Ile)-lysidine synthase
MSFEENVRKAVSDYDMLKDTSAVYVGLSGGADSVSLLLVLKALSEEYGFSVRAVHVNHHLRGKESDRDMEFCAALCERENVPLDVYHVNAKEYSESHGLSVEEGARELRYEIFSAIPKGCRFATAHTLSDSAETVLFNLARGTGIKGLTGIPPVRDNFIRPLIYCKRADVEEFLRQKNQDYVTDSTNLTDDCSRNIIRHKIVPVMQDIHGGFYGNVRRMTENLSADSDCLEMLARENAGNDLRRVHKAVRRRVIRNILSDNHFEISYAKIDEIDKVLLDGGGTVNLSDEISLDISEGKVTICPNKAVKMRRINFHEIPANVGINTFLCDKKVIIYENKCEKEDYNRIVNKNFTKEVLDCDKIQGKAVLRNRRDGDSYKLIGRNFNSKLKKLLNENCPQEKRDYMAVIADEEGIIWTELFGIADRVKTDDKTKRIWDIRVE